VASFGYTAAGGGTGAGRNIAFWTLSSTLPWMAWYPFTNTSGSPVFIDTATLLNVTAANASSVTVGVYDSMDWAGGLGTGLRGESAALAGLAVGSNAFTFATPILVMPGGRVWVVLRAAGGTPFVTCSGVTRFDEGVLTNTNPNTALPAGFPEIGWMRSDLILPIDLSGLTTGTFPTTDERVALVASEPLAEGLPAQRVALAVSEPLTEGQPYVRDSLTVSEPLTEGAPNVRVPLIVLEPVQAILEERTMATDLFPTLRGLTYQVGKKPVFNTGNRPNANLRSIRTPYAQFAAYDFSLDFEFLEDDQGAPNVALGTTDYRYLTGFFIQQKASWGDWLFRDPDDRQAVAEAMLLYTDAASTTADGVTTEFYFSRAMGPAIEPVGQVDQLSVLSFQPAAVSTGADTIAQAGHGLANGAGPYFLTSTGTLPGGTTDRTPYWVAVVDVNTFKLAISAAAALAGTPVVDLTSQGTGTISLTGGYAVYLAGPEAATVPVTPGPYTVTVARAAEWVADGGVTVDSTGAALLAVVGAPAAGQYSVLAGVYTFNVAQQGVAVTITYTSQAAAADTAFVVPNRLTFTVAPVAGLTAKATFNYLFVCHFLDDSADFQKWADKLWELGELTFRAEPQ
jgi:hypothetical protein